MTWPRPDTGSRNRRNHPRTSPVQYGTPNESDASQQERTEYGGQVSGSRGRSRFAVEHRGPRARGGPGSRGHRQQLPPDGRQYRPAAGQAREDGPEQGG